MTGPSIKLPVFLQGSSIADADGNRLSMITIAAALNAPAPQVLTGEGDASSRELAHKIFDAWRDDPRWKRACEREIPGPLAFFWAQIAADATLVSQKTIQQIRDSANKTRHPLVVARRVTALVMDEEWLARTLFDRRANLDPPLGKTWGEVDQRLRDGFLSMAHAIHAAIQSDPELQRMTRAALEKSSRS